MAIKVESDSLTPASGSPTTTRSASRTAAARRRPRAATAARTCAGQATPRSTESFVLIAYDPDVPADASDVNQEGKTLARGRRARRLRALAAGRHRRRTPPSSPRAPARPRSSSAARTRAPSEHGVGGVNSYTDFLAGDPDMGGTYGHYDGPFPPFNDERLHHYHFVVYALDVPSVGLEGEFKLDDVREAIEGHVLDQGELVATYTLYEPLL